MRVRATQFIALALLVSVAARGENAPPCKLHRAAAIDMSYDYYGRPTIPVAINGVRLPFLIDTAGIFNAVSNQTVATGNLKTVTLDRRVIYNAVTGEAPTKAAIVEAVDVGPLPLKNMSFVVSTPHALGTDIGGSISGEFLHFFDIDFDFAAGKFNVFLQSECEDGVVYWTKSPHGVLPFETNRRPNNTEDRIFESLPDWHIVTRAKLDGVDVDVTIDTGASTSYMTLEDAKDIIPDSADEKSLTRLGGSPDPSGPAYTFPFKTLVLGDITVANPNVILTHNKGSAEDRVGLNRPQLILGASVLRRLHLYVAYRQKKIYFTDVSAK